MNSIKQLWYITIKDLKIFATDRLALFFAVLFPFFFVTMFYFLLGGVGSQDNRLVLHLATQESDGLSTEIIQSLATKDDSQLNPGEPEIVWDRDYNSALQSVKDKEMAGFLAFPSDFTEKILRGEPTNIEVIVNAQDTSTHAALVNLAGGIASRINTQIAGSKAIMELLAVQKLPDVYIPNTTDNSQITSLLITYDIQNVGAVEAENPSNYVIPGYLVMFVFFTAALGAEAIVRERKNQTLERLLTTSVKKETILGGIFSSTVVKGLIQLIIFWAAGIFIFKMEVGESPAGVILLSLLMVVMSAAFSIMLATLVNTQRAASSIGVLASLILAPLGGCWWPLFITPGWMQFLANFTPHGWATSGFNKLIVFGAGFSSAVPNMLVLVGFAIVFGSIAVLRFRTSSA